MPATRGTSEIADLNHTFRQMVQDLRKSREQVRREMHERSQTEKALRERDERFRMMIENSTDVITILEAGGEIQYESPSLERIFGYEPNQLIGKNVFDYVHPDDRQRIMEVFASTLQTQGVSETVQFRFSHQNGSWIYLEAT
ncbi:MAG: PAS domain S-box protein, partial [Proteobacteria bacterium]|nr:PAS domain S-box protein [Pseudomonadota bacterium]